MDGGRENRFLAGGAEISRRRRNDRRPCPYKSKSPDAKQHRSFYGSRLFSSNNGEAKKLLRSISNP